MSEHDKPDGGDALGSIYWRDEILQLMYWMAGEGIGSEFTLSDLRKFLHNEEEVLIENLEDMVFDGLLERAGGDKYALTALGRKEGGRRFADEFEEMLRPGHFECDEPDCDCHDPESTGDACKHFSPAHAEHRHS